MTEGIVIEKQFSGRGNCVAIYTAIYRKLGDFACVIKRRALGFLITWNLVSHQPAF